MYGTIFTLNIKRGHEETLLEALKEKNTSKADGMVAQFAMNPDDTEEWIDIAIFESKEACVPNANRLEQHESFLKIMEHLESEPQMDSWGICYQCH